MVRISGNLHYGIGRAYGDTHNAHTLKVGNIVTHIEQLLGGKAVLGDYLIDCRHLIHTVEIHSCYAKHREAVLQHTTTATRDNEYFEALAECRGYGIAIFGIVATDKVAIGGGDDTTIGHHAINIENNGLDKRYIFFEVSHMLLVISL